MCLQQVSAGEFIEMETDQEKVQLNLRTVEVSSKADKTCTFGISVRNTNNAVGAMFKLSGTRDLEQGQLHINWHKWPIVTALKEKFRVMGSARQMWRMESG